MIDGQPKGLSVYFFRKDEGENSASLMRSIETGGTDAAK